MARKLSPISPGEILLEEYLKPLGISQNQLARALDVPPGRVNEIVRARRAITPDTAARLALFFRTTPQFWLNLQAQYDGKLAASVLVPRLAKTIRPNTFAA